MTGAVGNTRNSSNTIRIENDAGSSQQSTNGWEGRHRERRAAVLQGAARHAAQRANDGLVAISSRLPYGLAIILPTQAIIESSYGSRSDSSSSSCGYHYRHSLAGLLPIAGRTMFGCRISSCSSSAKAARRGADVRPDFTGRRRAGQLSDRVAKISFFKCGKLHKAKLTCTDENGCHGRRGMIIDHLGHLHSKQPWLLA
jgi:hypothetical protein